MKKPSLFPIIFLLLFLCSACSFFPVEEEPLPPPVIKAYKSLEYQYFTVQRGTLTKYIDMAAKKVPAHEESASFSVSNALYRQVYVSLGDTVKAGDILAELEKTDLEKRLDDALYEKARVDINIRHAEESYLLDKKYNNENDFAHEKEMDGLNTKARILLSDIDSLQKQLEARTLTAPMDGVVTYLKTTRDGDRSVANEKFITITDMTASLYVVEDANAQYFKPGDTALMKISTVGYDFFEVTVVDPETAGVYRPVENAAYFTTGMDNGTVNNDTVTIRYIAEEKRDALYLPQRAVNSAEGRRFVYILNGDVREMLTIETGLEDSDGRVEIISGLKEGDSVVIS